MSRIYNIIFFSMLTVISICQGKSIQESKSERKSHRTEWMLSDLVVKTTDSIQIKGKA